MDYDTYGSTAVELAIDLANATLVSGVQESPADGSADPADHPAAGVSAFLAAHDQWWSEGTSPELPDDQAGAVVAIAGLVRAVALAGSEPDVRDRLNDLLALATPRPYATDHDGGLHLHYARPDAGVLEQLTTTVAMGLSQVVVQHGWQRLGVCAAESCGNVYVDTSRNASRRYCSNTCASRSTVAAYRARQRS